MAIIYQISEEGIEQINKFFTDEYAYKQWLYKLKTWEVVLEKTEEFVKFSGDSELKNEDIISYKTAIEAEIVNNFYHMAEALFNLIISCQTNIPWLTMKNIKFKDLCDYVRDVIITGELKDEYIRFLFIHGITEEERKKKKVVESIAFIKEFLRRLGKIFLDNELYNEYKHGLRLMPSLSEFALTPEEGETPLLYRKGNAHTYLKTILIQKKKKEELYKIQRETKSFDYTLYIRLSVIIYRLIHNLFDNRRQSTKLEKSDLISVGLFNEEKIDEIFKGDPNKSSLTIPYS